MSGPPPVGPVRREPPRFRQLSVQRTEELGPRLLRVTVGGGELSGFELPDPAGSVRLLLPDPGARSLTTPRWDGNEFRRDDGSRPVLRTVTPRHHRPDEAELDVDVVLHGPTPLATWARSATRGTPVALSGPGRGYAIDPRAGDLLLVGDESALPAIAQIMEAVPESVPLRVVVEVGEPSGQVPLPDRSHTEVTWLDQPATGPPGGAMVDLVEATDISDQTWVWVAGEAAAVQAIRRDLLGERSIPRSRAVIRGYWKHGRYPDGH